MNKKEIRKIIQEKKNLLTYEQIISHSKVIINQLLATSFYQNADIIFSYISYNQEVHTHNFIEYALKDGKKVAVPKVINSEIEFFYIHSLKDVTVGYQGILEPNTDEKADGQGGLLLMPGLAFDKKGNRIGYGGGFYDKYIQKYNNLSFYKIAIGYDFQLFDYIETKEYDQKIDMILTPHSKCC